MTFKGNTLENTFKTIVDFDFQGICDDLISNMGYT